jgi:gentisate 1,2-dioxygenase
MTTEGVTVEKKEPKIATRWEDLKWRDTPQTHSALIVDKKIGFDVKTISMFVQQIPPGRHSGRHRHRNEAIIFIHKGKGHTEIEGKDYPWKAGDAISIPVFAWHQHFNDGDEDVLAVAAINTPLMELLGLHVMEHSLKPNFSGKDVGVARAGEN